MYCSFSVFAASCRKLFLAAGFLAGSAVAAVASVPVPEWNKTLGGAKDEGLAIVQPTADGGYILGGISNSEAGEHKSSALEGNTDYWLVKTDAAGNKLWEKTFGGEGLETFQTLQQTSDGGFILGGSSQSGVSGSKSQPGLGNYDFWVVKTDAQGNKLWDKTFGDQGYDFLHSLEQTPDGGYVAGGVSFQKSIAENAPEIALEATYLIIKLDGAGNKIWANTVTNIDAEAEEPFVMHLTPDNGFMLAGSVNSATLQNATVKGRGASDFHLIKLNATGHKVWEKAYGGANDEFLSSLQLTADGGYVLGGISHSGKGADKTEGSHGKGDFWMLKVNKNGDKLWDKTFGGNDYDYLSALEVAEDGGYIIGGISRSGRSGDKSQATFGKTDYWVVKLDANGNKVWEQAYGGSKDDELYALTQTPDGGLLLGGNSTSGAESSKADSNNGGKDIWLVKLRAPVISWNSF